MKRFLIVTALFVLVACDSTSEETPPPSLTVSPMVLTLTVGESQPLELTTTGTTIGAEVTFTSDTPSVASVDENGVVEAVSLGTATITVSIDDLMKTVTVNVTGDIAGATCQGDFTVTSRAELEALSDCAVIDGTLVIDDSGYDENGFRVDDVDDITDLVALSGLRQINNLHIATNLALTSLTGLERLTTVTGNLIIGDVPGLINFPEPTPFLGNNLLTTLSGLNNLRSVGGNLSIECNDNLESLEGLESLETVAGNVSIFWNWGLETLESISSVVIGGSLVISENPALEQETLTASD